MFRKRNLQQQCAMFISQKLAKSTHVLVSYFNYFAHSCIHIILYKLKYIYEYYLKNKKCYRDIGPPVSIISNMNIFSIKLPVTI